MGMLRSIGTSAPVVSFQSPTEGEPILNAINRPLSDVERTTIRRGQTAANSKYSIGGRLKEASRAEPRSAPAEKRESPCRAYNRTLVIKVDDETLQIIARRALVAGTSKAEQVRLLLEWGLEADNASAA